MSWLVSMRRIEASVAVCLSCSYGHTRVGTILRRGCGKANVWGDLAWGGNGGVLSEEIGHCSRASLIQPRCATRALLILEPQVPTYLLEDF